MKRISLGMGHMFFILRKQIRKVCFLRYCHIYEVNLIFKCSAPWNGSKWWSFLNKSYLKTLMRKTKTSWGWAVPSSGSAELACKLEWSTAVNKHNLFISSYKCCLSLRLYSYDIVFNWEPFQLRSSSFEVVFHIFKFSKSIFVTLLANDTKHVLLNSSYKIGF